MDQRFIHMIMICSGFYKFIEIDDLCYDDLKSNATKYKELNWSQYCNTPM